MQRNEGATTHPTAVHRPLGHLFLPHVVSHPKSHLSLPFHHANTCLMVITVITDTPGLKACRALLRPLHVSRPDPQSSTMQQTPLLATVTEGRTEVPLSTVPKVTAHHCELQARRAGRGAQAHNYLVPSASQRRPRQLCARRLAQQTPEGFSLPLVVRW